MDKHDGFMKALKCRECGREYPLAATHVCEFDFGPLEVAYDYPRIKQSLTRAKLETRPRTMWRYRELLPVAQDPTVGTQVGFTPIVRADRLARRLGVRELWIKNDAVNYPTLSFKDRVVSVALSRARELGFKTVACASTGNLANSVAANAASAGLKSYVLIPADLEQGKVLGSLVYGTEVIGIHGPYDHVNRLCSEIAGKYGWGFVNVNLRPYYAEGSKTMGFEIAEQLGWRGRGRHPPSRGMRRHFRRNGRRRHHRLHPETHRHRRDPGRRQRRALHHRPRPEDPGSDHRQVRRTAPHQTESSRVRRKNLQ